MSPQLEKPARDRCMAALTIAQEALRRIANAPTDQAQSYPPLLNQNMRETATHALNKIGILMTDGE